ncbi:hypothetical protein GMSM_32540 [Geomonas sp. Red276]
MSFHLSDVSLPQTDNVDSAISWGKDSNVEPPLDAPEHLKAPFSVILTGILNDDRTTPVKINDQVKGEPAKSDIYFVFLGVVRNPHGYIRNNQIVWSQ